MVTLTYSTLSTFQECPRKYRLSQIDGYERIYEDEPLTRGILGHEAMEIRKTQGIKAAQEHIRLRCLERAEKEFDRDGTEQSEFWERLEASLLGAVTHFPFSLNLAQTEFQFSHPLRNHRLCGKLDGICIPKIIDYKFTGRFDSWQKADLLELNMQADIYSWAMWKEGRDISGVDFYLFKTPYLKQHKKESFERFKERIIADFASRTAFYYDKRGTERNRNRDFRTITAAFQNTFVLHHIELLTGYRLFPTEGLDDITDAHFFFLKQFDDLQPNRVSNRF